MNFLKAANLALVAFLISIANFKDIVPDYNIFAADLTSSSPKVSADDSAFHNEIYLVPVVDFKSKRDDVNITSIKDLFNAKTVFSEEAYKALQNSEAGHMKLLKVSNVQAYLKDHLDSIGVVRISELTPAVRALPVNGIYFYESQKKYILSLNQSENQENEKSNIFTFAQTGVTALTRGIIKKINEQKDPLFISKQIAPFLRQFNLTHTSNEVSFSENCKFVVSTMEFCSPISYYKILEDSGFDIIELTGNHNNDYGYQANEFTLNLYEQHGLKYYGGGKNLQEAKKTLYVNVAGKKIALIAYNEANVYYQYDLPLAKEKQPGANPFDMDKMKLDIADARKNADTVIVDFQFAECNAYKPEGNDDCYQPMIKPDQREVFRKAVDFGADIVVGTQAHQPQIIENYQKGIIFYGLGNLYFDQIRWEGTRQGMILVHIFYEGTYKNTIVYPTYFDNDMQVHLVNGQKKKELLDIYYQRK